MLAENASSRLVSVGYHQASTALAAGPSVSPPQLGELRGGGRAGAR
jgi:hypothetical protein